MFTCDQKNRCTGSKLQNLEHCGTQEQRSGDEAGVQERRVQLSRLWNLLPRKPQEVSAFNKKTQRAAPSLRRGNLATEDAISGDRGYLEDEKERCCTALTKMVGRFEKSRVLTNVNCNVIMKISTCKTEELQQCVAWRVNTLQVNVLEVWLHFRNEIFEFSQWPAQPSAIELLQVLFSFWCSEEIIQRTCKLLFVFWFLAFYGSRIISKTWISFSTKWTDPHSI